MRGQFPSASKGIGAPTETTWEAASAAEMRSVMSASRRPGAGRGRRGRGGKGWAGRGARLRVYRLLPVLARCARRRLRFAVVGHAGAVTIEILAEIRVQALHR